MKIYDVIFNNNNITYQFKSNLDIPENQAVIVDTERGLQYAKALHLSKKSDLVIDELKEIVRIATEKDDQEFFNNLKKSQMAYHKCKELVRELNLPMNIINSSFNLDYSQLFITFSADERVDFRELAKKLASLYHTRIELRQIGARDRAKRINGIGICGQELCCAKFLKQIDSISINKAKNQNLALNPSKINGLCGRLLCCLCYEDEEYKRCNKDLLTTGSHVKINGEDGIIISVNILERSYVIQINNQKYTVKADELNDSKK